MATHVKINTKALEWAGVDAAYAKEVGYDLVHVDENGEPDGSETIFASRKPRHTVNLRKRASLSCVPMPM